ncbi:hypothetical protein KKC97_08175 [bacterium]|nr:hypothetical protein [bacterium]MBU1637625.1 hypothetical protein [bacterium]RQV93941.1 MAG: hypothetical protein EH220_07795 [bacterium]
MKVFVMTLITAVWMFLSGVSVSAQTSEENPPDEVATETEALSTEMIGVDSLDVMPDEMITKSGSGTRRVKLETTVFRREEPIVYKSEGLRDPFRALISDEKKEGEVKTDLLRVEDAVLTGIVWSSGDYVAMVRDKEGKSFFLREGDAIYQGRVLEVEQSRVVLEVSEFGDYRRVTLDVQG